MNPIPSVFTLGSYDFSFAQLNASFSLSGHHNNTMYSDGIEIEVLNKSKKIETLGINFNTDTFIEIDQNGNELLKYLQITLSIIKTPFCPVYGE